MKIGRLAEIMAAKYKVVAQFMSQFGWWIFPDGSVSGQVEDHEGVAERYLARIGNPIADDESAEDKLIAMGGMTIRIYHGKVMVVCNKLDPTHSEYIKKFLSEYFDDSDNIEIFESVGGSPIVVVKKTIGDFLKSHSSNEGLPITDQVDYTTKWARLAVKYKAASYDMVDYGWWIYPDGTIAEVHDHNESALLYYEPYFDFSGSSLENMNKCRGSKEKLWKDGGVSVRSYGAYLHFIVDRFDAKCMSNIRRFIEEKHVSPDQRIVIGDSEINSKKMTAGEFLAANDPSDVEPERDYTTKWANLAVKYKAGQVMGNLGWWIFPNGTVKSRIGSHELAAEDYLFDNGIISEDHEGISSEQMVIGMGGVTIRMFHGTLVIVTKNLDSITSQRIKDFLRSKSFKEDNPISLATSSKHHDMTVGEFLQLDSLSDLSIAERVDYTKKWASLDIGTTLRTRITNLSNIINKTHGILRECADSDAKNPKNDREASAVKGFEFIKKVVGMIDYLDALKDHQSQESLKEIYLAALILKETIEQNLTVKHEGRDVQFPHVSDLIWEMKPLAGKKWDDFRKYESAKARGGLARIMSIAIDMLKDLKDAGINVGFGKVEDDDRFKPQRAELSSRDIIPFLLEYGPEYGIDSTDEWIQLLDIEPDLKSRLTTIINALNRGHGPADAGVTKKQIKDILEDYRAKNRTPMGEPKVGNEQYLGILERKYS